jgi:ubiquinone/menaquinone biosynthesis C-methylase UbiE
MSKPIQLSIDQARNEGTSAIYNEDYAATYPSLYITPWRAKHDLNIRNLEAVFRTLAAPIPDWLDLACGQAWHFSMFPGRARMVGLDLSAAQLRRARTLVPDAIFTEGDIVSASFPKSSFDLVTNFWAGYCYLGTNQRITAMLSKTVRWIRAGGAFYMEVLLARDLEDFNRSNFARQTGFKVVPRSEDYNDWQYDDVGGHHEMTSPPLEFFLDFLTPAFGQIKSRHDGGFMVHLIATGRK